MLTPFESTPSESTPNADEVLVLLAHPQIEQSHINRRLTQAAKDAAAQNHKIVVRDLYALYPDFFIDVAAEQVCLSRARLVVWQHPTHWYGMTPLMKLWVDEVLSLGWAYGPGGTALHHKQLWLVTSTGGTEASYQPDGHNRYAFGAFMPPYEQTAALCGMRFLTPWVLHGAHHVAPEELEKQATTYAARLLCAAENPAL
jgi:glutathione-regulated potassium-efflux system ancillary protein KefF